MDNKEETKQPVDISHNNNDSSVYSFHSHLTAAFKRKGIKQFYGLKLFLVIFSSGYASSVSCLENLVEFLELSRGDKNRYEVVPVFYGVSRLDVKQQSGTFRDAFIELERLYSAVQVTKWRFALTKTAELKGYGYNDKSSDEFNFLEEIAQDVFEKLYPTEEIGIHKRQVDIENLLCKQPWGLRTLGILGEPRIGKTTLTRAVHRLMSRAYDESCFIEDFHTRYSEMRLEPLHGDFLCMTPTEVFDLNNSPSEPCHRQKRVLVVLDDVRNAQEAKSFLGAVDQFGAGSLIIITSRDRQVLEQYHVNEIYELKGLNDDDALKLFTRCAFGNGVIEQNLLDLSLRVIKCSDGNPSTLRSYAEKVKGKTRVEMEQALFRICDDAFIYTKKNTSIRFFSNIGQDDEEYGVLATEHTKYIFLEQSILNFLSHLEEHSDISSPTSDLRVPHLGHDHMHVQSLPHHFHRKQLFLLQGLASQFHKLWEGYNKRFSRLRKINFGHFEKLVEVEELSNAHNLEQIDLRDCKSLESIPVTDKLEHLQVLNLSGCTGIKHFPNNVRTIKELNLEGTGIREIRSETTHYSKLVKQHCATTSELTKSF